MNQNPNSADPTGFSYMRSDYASSKEVSSVVAAVNRDVRSEPDGLKEPRAIPMRTGTRCGNNA